jgi:O-antigen ligase
MYGILIYAATLAYVPQPVILLAAFLLLRDYYGTRFQKGSWKTDLNVPLLLLIVLTVLINRIVHLGKIESLKDYFPEVLLLPYMYLISITLKSKDLRILIWLIAIEAAVGILQRFTGVNTFFHGIGNSEIITETRSLWYFNRPYGFSMNSSTLSLKIFLAIVTLESISDRIRYRNLLRIILIAGVIIAFNRTAMVSVIALYALTGLRAFIIRLIEKSQSKSLFSKLKYKSLLVFLAFLAGIIFIGFTFWDFIIEQFTRNQGVVELSGRAVIWQGFFDFIKTHFWFGNGSYKFFIPYHDGRMAHAHNSYIQYLASNGFIAFFLYMWLIFRNINKINFIFVIPILVFSLAQYGIFWGISIADILLFTFLFQHKIIRQIT